MQSVLFWLREMYRERLLPFVTTLHGTDITLVGTDKQFYDVTRFSIDQSDGVTAVSNSLRDETLEIFDTDCRIQTIYNFVDMDHFQRKVNPTLRRRYALENEKILIHISNFRPVKRIADVCEVFARINASSPSKLLLVGDGPDIQIAQRFAERKQSYRPHSFFG
jgi:L-malate glycosyltransferase